MQVWAYANIGVNPGEDLLQDFARAAIQKMPEFRWAAPMGCCGGVIVECSSCEQAPDQFLRAVPAMSALQSTNRVVSLARSTSSQPADSPARLACPTWLLHCSPQNISNFLWAFAKLGIKSPELFVEGEAPCCAAILVVHA